MVQVVHLAALFGPQLTLGRHLSGVFGNACAAHGWCSWGGCCWLVVNGTISVYLFFCQWHRRGAV